MRDWWVLFPCEFESHLPHERETHSKFIYKQFWVLFFLFPVNIGELSEWFKEAVLKTVVRLVTGPGVRISYSPQ